MAYYSVRKQAVGLIGWLLVSFAAATVGGIASASAGDFYRQLDRPGWAPPGWLFAPVWTVLYTLQGVGAWLVWRERHASGRRTALGAFLAQLAVNALWSWLFFAWRQGGLAFGEVLLLFVMVGVTIATFWRVRPVAGALLLPYLLWVGFATALTYSVWQRNPSSWGDARPRRFESLSPNRWLQQTPAACSLLGVHSFPGGGGCRAGSFCLFPEAELIRCRS